MEKFVVSARKYRPNTFDSVVGQNHITTTLRNAIKTDHLAQAFLFCGPRGVGKTTCARILAKTINCQNRTEDMEPCNKCTSCTNFEQNASFNIHELDAASNNSVEDIRNLIDQVRFPPQDGKYKVYIIDEVHMLSQQAFNAFLKTLEEPPSYAIFILATTEKHKILPTILSRCQTFDFNRIKIKDMADHLESIGQKEGIETERPALELIAQKAEGGLRDALSMFDLNVTFSDGNKLVYEEVLSNLHVLDYDYYFRIVNALIDSDLSEVLLIFNEIIDKGFDAHQFVNGLNEHLRNLLISQDPRTIKLFEVAESIQAKYLEQSKKLEKDFLLSLLSIGSNLDLNYKQAKNSRLHVELGLIKMAYVNQVLVIEPQASTPSSGEKKNSEPIVEKAPKKKQLKSVLDIESPKAEEETVAPKVEQQTEKNDIQEAIDLYKATHKKTTLKIILESPRELIDNKLVFKLQNKIQGEYFEEVKQEFTDFLRENTGNKNLELDCEIKAQVVERKPRTEQEKFHAMSQKNPALNALKDDLGLDLSY